MQKPQTPARLRYVTFWNRAGSGEPLRPDESGFPDARPSFASETWPLIEKNKNAVAGLYWWNRQKSLGRPSLLTPLVASEAEVPGFFRLHDFALLSDDGLNRVFTCTDSNVDVFFETGDQWFLRHLCALWPRAGVLRTDRERLDQIGEADFELLCQAVATIPTARVWFSFDDEGWLLYIFGSAGLISWAQAVDGNRTPAENRLKSLEPETETS